MSFHETRDKKKSPMGWVTDLWVRVGLLLVGVWLTIAPYALEYRATGSPARATVNDSVAGVLVVALALVSLVGIPRSRR